MLSGNIIKWEIAVVGTETSTTKDQFERPKCIYSAYNHDMVVGA